MQIIPHLIKLSKTQLHKIGQSRGFLGRLLRPLLKTGLPLIKNVLKPLAQSFLIPLGLTTAAATDAAIHKKMFLGNASLLGNLLAGKDPISAGEGTIRVGQFFQCRLILQQNLKYKGIIKMNLILKVLIQEIICLK